MTNSKYNPTLVEEGLGALAVGLTVLASPLLRPWYSKWGATEAETMKSLPGDEQVPNPNMVNTRAITIEAPVATVWPWLVQMGQGRGGLYSYERLENLVGCEMHNADEILPEYQELMVGDMVRLSEGDEGPHFVVTAVYPQKIAAALAHKSQFPKGEENLEWMKELDKKPGVKIGVTYAELFKQITVW